MDIIRLFDLRVEKVWNVSSDVKIPDKIIVELLRSGEAIDTITLSGENNWTYTWMQIEKCDEYSVLEKDIPDGYVVSYRVKDNLFVITNTKELVQTGRAMWIPVLGVLVGFFLISFGIILNKVIVMSKIGKILIFVGILLVISSFGFLLYCKYEDNMAGDAAASVLSVVKEYISDQDYTIIDGNSDGTKMLTMDVNGYDYIGTVVIPSLNLELPVMSFCDEERLKISPCQYYGSVYTDDLIICAHSYKSHFGYLSKLDQKDIVIFTDIYGDIYTYEVIEIEILDSDDVSLMIENEFDLTLYTCTNDGMDRLTVRCNRVNSSIS